MDFTWSDNEPSSQIVREVFPAVLKMIEDDVPLEEIKSHINKAAEQLIWLAEHEYLHRVFAKKRAAGSFIPL